MIVIRLLLILMLFPLNEAFCQKIIFLHHSTGSGLYNQGNVNNWIINYNSVHSTSYEISDRSYPNTPYPWENYPFDYWNLWINRTCNNTDPDIACLDQLCTNYDVIIFKHCFPGADIVTDIASPSVNSSVKCLANYKLQYRALRELMDSYPNNKFIVWTLVPLHRLATTTQNAARAKEFVNWVKNEWLVEDGKSHPNIFVFDFFGLAAESNPNPVNGQVNCLKYDYESSHTGVDSHPNLLANQTIGPIFAQFIVNVIEENPNIPVTGITVTGAGGVSTINTDNGTLQLNAAILPVNATNKNINWSIQNGTGQATINSSGLVTAVNNGVVTARATANDGSGAYGTLTITISNQVILVTSINVAGAGGATTISTDNGTLQLNATVFPADATNKTVTWSIQNGTGLATINSSGLVTAVNNGVVTARATANDGSGAYGTLTITISNQVILVTGINVAGAGGASTISTDNGTLQLNVTVIPADANDKTVTWSIQNGTGQATINSSGLVTAVNNGVVTARATANDGSGAYGTLTITISNQVILVTGINVTGAGGATTISIDNGTLQLYADVSPPDASNKTVTWSVENGTGQATINASGLVTAISVGTVTARATANDGSGVDGTFTITILIQVVPVTGITVTGDGEATTISTDNGTLQLSAAVAPDVATDKSVTWSIQNSTGQASISTSGLVTAISNGTVTARATANDGSGIYGALVITITNQVVSVSSISVTGAGGASIITSDNGTLQLTATVAPDNASDKSFSWSIQNGTGQATISTSGLVTAISNGTITARAAANDGSGIIGTLNIVISNQIIPVTVIDVTCAGGSTAISTDNGTLQLNAEIYPPDATNKTVTWSVENGTGQASVIASGLLTAISNGTVTARATANDGSGIYGTLLITISNQVVSVSSVSVNGAGGASIITSDNGTLQLIATVSPENATNKTVTWSVQNGSGQASLNASGLVSAVNNGTVTARATANDGSGIYGTLTITISNQVIPVSGITVTGAGDAATISTDNGTLQLSANITPVEATNTTVTWSIQNNTGQASISSSGLVTAVSNGTVTARATANDGSGVYGILTITISNQVILVSDITITGDGGASTISIDKGTLQLSLDISPADATNKTVIWSIQNGTGQAYISSSGLVTAVKNGTITAWANARDGSGVYGLKTITISNQVIPVTGITITGAGGVTTISTDNGTLQLSASVTPDDATNKEVRWSIQNGTGQATINDSGIITAVSNGTITATATAQDGAGVYGTLGITISNQFIPVTSITVSGIGGLSTISTDNGTLQLSAAIIPANATNKNVTWTIQNGTGEATISTSGLVTAVSSGTVTARATAQDGSEVFYCIELNIDNQINFIETIIIYSDQFLTTIDSISGKLQLLVKVFPESIKNPKIEWKVINGTGTAMISETGLLTALSYGSVTVEAKACDGSGIYSKLNIFIGNVHTTTEIFLNKTDPFISYSKSEIRVNNIDLKMYDNIHIFSAEGKLVAFMKPASDQCFFNLSDISNGLYLIIVSGKAHLKTFKIIIN